MKPTDFPPPVGLQALPFGFDHPISRLIVTDGTGDCIRPFEQDALTRQALSSDQRVTNLGDDDGHQLCFGVGLDPPSFSPEVFLGS